MEMENMKEKLSCDFMILTTRYESNPKAIPEMVLKNSCP